MMQPFFLAILGGSASGKTSLAEAIVKSLPPGRALLLREDDYYHCSSMVEGFDPLTFNFDEPGAKDHALLGAHLIMARMGQAFERPVYDFVTHRRQPITVTAIPAPLIVVDGLHLLSNPALTAAFDAAVFVDTPESVRFDRRLSRDIAERGRDEHQVRTQFATRVQPMHERHVTPQKARAQLVVSGEDPLEALVALTRTLLPESLKA
jgi:uridine kinase